MAIHSIDERDAARTNCGLPSDGLLIATARTEPDCWGCYALPKVRRDNEVLLALRDYHAGEGGTDDLADRLEELYGEPDPRQI